MTSSLWHILAWSGDSTSCVEMMPPAIGGSGWKPESFPYLFFLYTPLLGILKSFKIYPEFYYYLLLLRLHPCPRHHHSLFGLPYSMLILLIGFYIHLPIPNQLSHSDQGYSFTTLRLYPSHRLLETFCIQNKIQSLYRGLGGPVWSGSCLFLDLISCHFLIFSTLPWWH